MWSRFGIELGIVVHLYRLLISKCLFVCFGTSPFPKKKHSNEFEQKFSPHQTMLLLKRALKPGVVKPLTVRGFQTGSVLGKETSGRYKVTVNRSRPLTYEMSFKPPDIAVKKGYNSFNTAQLEDTFLKKEEMGQDLPYKMFVEDLFIRKFMHGTWTEAFVSEVIIKRHHNLVRIAGIINRNLRPKEVYFLIGYTEEILSYWLKCPVKLELQTVESNEDVIYKYI